MFNICSKNGEIIPIEKASINLESIESQYGLGVYETVKVRNDIVYFVPEHIERLLHSASCINLVHTFSAIQLQLYLQNFVKALNTGSCNIKILFYGGGKDTDATVYMLASAPLYPHRKWYKEGVTLISHEYERWMPQAKTLNMVASYYIYSLARKSNCYDALLINREGEIREGTRTNIYVIKDKKIVSPPKDVILEGVTMKTVEKVINATDYTLEYKEIKLNDLESYDGMFLTSTSSKILPIQKVDDMILPIPQTIRDLMEMYDEALEKSRGDFNLL